MNNGSSITILCVHGVGHGDVDPNLRSSWTNAITQALTGWKPDLRVAIDFMPYDELFSKAPLNPVVYAEAMAKLLASGVVHGIGDLFTRKRGLFDIPEEVRWTAGMVAQWASEDALRAQTRNAVLTKLKTQPFDIICAHSLGSLICYDTFRRNPDAISGKYFISFGSQIGNPFVRDIFAGRIEPLKAKAWYHLFNPDDHALTSDITISAENFVQIQTEFEQGILNHDAVHYLRHENTRARAWREISGATVAPVIARSIRAFQSIRTKPKQRALLIGINEYPDPTNRLEGCVNDVFLMSSVLQESGVEPGDIRVVLNDRATADGILTRLHWLLDDLRAGDQRVLFYSGHGAQIPAYGAHDEPDHYDECLVPYDFDWTPQHAITDNQFYNLYTQLPYDSHFLAVFDCCYSGGMTREGALRVRGLTPPDDIRHRSLRWNTEMQMWIERSYKSPNPTISDSPDGTKYLGISGTTHRLGRAIGLRILPKDRYNRTRRELDHYGPYLPIIMEACGERQYSYEYRHGVTSYGAFTYSLSQILRSRRQAGDNPTFHQLVQLVAKRLRELKYDQTPNLVGAKKAVNERIPWITNPRTRPRRGRR